MHHLSCYKVVVFCFILWITGSSTVQAQINTKGSYNFRDFQNKPYYFGLTLAANTSSFKIDHSKNFNTKSTYRIAEASSKTGFTLNMIANLKLGQFFDFRLLPGFTYTERQLVYTMIDSENYKQEGREAFFFELPFHVRYKSQPYKDKRLFLVGGVKYGYDVTSKSNAKKPGIKFSPHDFHVEAGIGMQFFFPYFIFSPEIKFSKGIGNTLLYDQNIEESRILESVSSQMVTISFHFEG